MLPHTECAALTRRNSVELIFIYKPAGLALESIMPRAANTQNPLLQFVSNGRLVVQILIGLVAGIILALVSPAAAAWVAILGNLFVSALQAVAPNPNGQAACRE